MYSVLNIDTLRRGESDKGSVMKDFGAPYHISWRPGVQSSHLTIPNRHMQCEFNPNADVPPTYNTNLNFAATFASVAVFITNPYGKTLILHGAGNGSPSRRVLE